MQKDIAVIHTVPPLHPDPQDLSFTHHTRATDGEMALGSLIAEPIPNSVAVRLTGRFELNGDKSRNGLRWPLYARLASPGDRFPQWDGKVAQQCPAGIGGLPASHPFRGGAVALASLILSSCDVVGLPWPGTPGLGIIGKQNRGRFLPLHR